MSRTFDRHAHDAKVAEQRRADLALHLPARCYWHTPDRGQFGLEILDHPYLIKVYTTAEYVSPDTVVGSEGELHFKEHLGLLVPVFTTQKGVIS